MKKIFKNRDRLIFGFIAGFFISCTVQAAPVCCCDDDRQALNSEIQSARQLATSYQENASKTMENVTKLREQEKPIVELLVIQERALNSASRLRDAASAKEAVEGLVAKAALDSADIEITEAIQNMRQKVGREAENLEAKKVAK